MKVIALKNTKNLVKGATYDVYRLFAAGNYKRVVIKLNKDNKVNYAITNFKLSDGNPIPLIDWKSDEIEDRPIYIDERNIKIGDYIKYTRNSHVGLINGSIYKIEDIKISKRSTYSNYSDISIKIYGSKTYYKSYSFVKCSDQESREIQLKSLFEEESGFMVADKNVNKLSFYSEDEQKVILINSLMTSALDKKRNNMSVVDWALKKVNNYNIKEEDYKNILDQNFNTILEIFK